MFFTQLLYTVLQLKVVTNVIVNPSAWSDEHCSSSRNATCRGVTSTARLAKTPPVVE